ncbi:SDR family NAD(P)-dependent oxidoreductase [Curvivirga aplysinae]|uniref:SDR family NAD(P)-dependent oxidoreductase n=1 Tax=Curvivirga aplysinae TaxID=2529852 RepID=UPI0012BCF5FB|nr:SDR family NAD(P)-dependent oxidoreductase [Curvivirga aplysinae]MTI08991.1 SDR family NAD(P)-dependent oxidoreductase [Curvivirga aplysinae]
MTQNIVVFGGGGAIGNALSGVIRKQYPDVLLHIVSSKEIKDQHPLSEYYLIDYNEEGDLKRISEQIASFGSIDLLIVASGILHGADFKPEKSLRDLDIANFQKLFLVNSIFPAMVAKYCVPLLSKDERSVFAILSARVGSISDNQLGGWYAYRASKAALNMIIKTTSIEVARNRKQAIVVGLHPGTVQSELSMPFTTNVTKDQLFTPDFAAGKLLDVIASLDVDDSGKCFAWDGQEILP